MNAQALMNKFKLYPIASISGGVIVVLLLAMYLRGMGQADQQARHDQAVQKWNQMEVNVFKNSVDLEAHLESARMVSQDVRERLIRPSELARNYQHFYRLESSSGVRITSLQQQPAPPPAPARANAPRTEAKPAFSKVGYTMSVTGGFQQILQFLYSIEHGQHFFNLRDFSLQRSALADARDVSITMNFELLGTP